MSYHCADLSKQLAGAKKILLKRGYELIEKARFRKRAFLLSATLHK